jgi:hypothetical protein
MLTDRGEIQKAVALAVFSLLVIAVSIAAHQRGLTLALESVSGPTTAPAALLATIPLACRTGQKVPERAAEILRIVASKPSAEAYNALGAIYGRFKRLPCAVVIDVAGGQAERGS